MWRSLFLAIGIMAIIIGVEALLIDSASMYSASDSSAADFVDPGVAPGPTVRTWKPSERFPWAALALGGVIVLYAITLPKRWHMGAHG